MKVLVAMDGSEYGEWGLKWVATLPFAKPPRVTALHVLDSAWMRLPFRTKLEMQRVTARAAKILLLREMRPTYMIPTLWEEGTEEAITVMVVHVMPSSKSPEMKDAGKALVQTYGEKLVMAGYDVEEILRFGSPADEILELAHRSKADLIVTGAKGKGAIARLLLGSVSTRLIQHSRCSVLLVR